MGRCAGPKSDLLMNSAFSVQLSCASGREVLSFLSAFPSEVHQLVDLRGGLDGDSFHNVLQVAEGIKSRALCTLTERTENARRLVSSLEVTENEIVLTA